MNRRKLVLFAACAAMVLIMSGLRAQAQTLYDPNEPGSFLVFPKFERGTVATPAGTVPATEIEITAHCPLDQQPCTVPGTKVRLQGQWVCPGNFTDFKCKENNFIFETTQEGTVNFSTEGSRIGGSTGFIVPAPPCNNGFLIVYAVNAKNQPIVFNGLLGDAVLRWNGTAAGAYNAISVQGIGATNTVITTAKIPSFNFDGFSGHYAALAGTAMSTIKYPQPTGASPDSPSETTLTLLTLDTLSNRPNYDTFVDLLFYDANENVISEATDFVCWTEVAVDNIDANLISTFMTRKGFFWTLDAVKVPEFGVADTAGPVTLLGLVDTVECEGNATCPAPTAPRAGANPTVVNHYMYKDDDDSIPLATTFVGL